jgi:putative membrane protein
MHPAFASISLPMPLLALMGTIVSILLAFRTSQSYERWWEARIIWGAIVNDSRTLVREAAQFLGEAHEDALRDIAERHIVWPYALGESLRRLPFSPKVTEYITSNDVHGVNIPNALLDEHSRQVGNLYRKGAISEFNQMQLNGTISKLCDSMGKCERIKNTVFPRSYSLMLHTLIYIFTAMLPFGLDHSQLVVEIILSVLIPVMFIAVEKTAIIMQDPFENTPVDTPMTALAQTIEINIRQATGGTLALEKQNNGLYYQM